MATDHGCQHQYCCHAFRATFICAESPITTVKLKTARVVLCFAVKSSSEDSAGRRQQVGTVHCCSYSSVVVVVHDSETAIRQHSSVQCTARRLVFYCPTIAVDVTSVRGTSPINLSLRRPTSGHSGRINDRCRPARPASALLLLLFYAKWTATVGQLNAAVQY